MFTDYSIHSNIILLLTTLVVLAYLVYEVYRHRRRLYAIPVRIHVNGTRGKSSVTRLIAAGLRAGDIRTVTKTTGTMARFIDPSGKEEAVFRWGRTNVIEQVRIVKKASRYQPQALVIECMAVQPLLQSLCELKLIRSTHGVLVNARADHLDVMGPTEADVAKALAGTMPIKGKFFTTERRHLKTFQMAARDRKTEVLALDANDVGKITKQDMSGFHYAEHEENVALALTVCKEFGVDRKTALHGMWQATPDPGALTLYEIAYQQKKIVLANGFAANDPISTGELWHRMLKKYADCEQVVALVNTRNDREDRSIQMAESLLTWELPNVCLAIGTGTSVFLKTLGQHQAKSMMIKNGEGWNTQQILNYLVETCQASRILLIGICNIKGIGFALLNYFEQHQVII